MEPGTVLLGRYRVEALIGKGGMGQVFSAIDGEGGPEVAVKVVSRAANDRVLATRLLREAEAVTRLRSDWVPRLLDVGESGSGEVFLVLERLVGTSLSQLLRERGPMPWTDVARIGEDILRGLIDAHTAGVVHRDLKPSNVFLAVRGTDRSRAMILDFGVCKIQGDDAERLTGTGESLGTVAYMAPEQVRGASDVDDRADLYAFGVLVYEMLSGTLPHDGPTQMAVLASKLEQTPPPLAERVAGAVPSGLDALVARALAREPGDRFASAQELLRAWRALDPRLTVRGPSSSSPALTPFTPRSSARTVVVAAPSSRDVTRDLSIDAHPTDTAYTAGISLSRGPRGMRVALGLAILGLVVGVVAVLASFGREPPEGARVPAAASAAETVAPAPPLAPPEPAEPAEPPDAPVEVGELDNGAPVPTSTASSPRALPPVAPSRVPRRAAPRTVSSGSRITTQPRY